MDKFRTGLLPGNLAQELGSNSYQLERLSSLRRSLTNHFLPFRRHNLQPRAAAREHSCPMPLGICMISGKFLARGRPGALEFSEIFLEWTNGSRLGGTALASLGQTALRDAG